MRLIREIQDNAVGPDVPVAVLLRKCKILATRLSYDPLKQWTEYELNGYADGVDLPSYRVDYPVALKGNFSGPWGSGLLNADVPFETIPKEYRDNFKLISFTEGVAVLESYVAKVRGHDDDHIKNPLPADLVARFPLVYQGMSAMQIWRFIPIGHVVAVLDQVRNRVLSFALEIESANPEADEATPGSIPVPLERVNHIYNTFIMGGTNAWTSGSSDFKQNIKQKTKMVTVAKGDLDSLLGYLRTLGVDDSDLDDLETSLKEDARVQEAGGMGEKTHSWLGKMLIKAQGGALNVGANAAGSLLADAILTYLHGLPG